ncbi:ABC transporter substrate-binding protein [Pseudoroseomonas globiformis]|uniref:ABC transporter substrate-binding protein n=1 Tax=Teichococcus globiformis TaxID=2307229 RepID=A0ABV7G5W8_9PROT
MSLWNLAARYGALPGTIFAAGMGLAAAQPAPKPGGHLIYAQSSFPPCLDLAQSARAQNASRQILDNLTDQDKKSGEIRPWLAISWEFQDENKTLVLKIRDGVRFSNGEKLDAAAVKANFDAIMKLVKEGRAPQAAGYLSGFVEAKAVDPMTVSLSFELPKAGLLQSLAEKPLSMLAPETLAKSADERCAGQLIGSGPFIITEVVTNDRIVFRRNPDYNWASPNAEHQGPAYLEKLTFQTVPEGGVRTGIMISGQAGAVDDIPVQSYAQVRAAGIKLVARTAGGVGINLIPNFSRPVMADLAVRRAMQHAINRDEIVKALYSDLDTAATSPLSHTVPFYADMTPLMKYDPERAKQILDEGGWKPGADGVREKEGRKLRMQVIWSFPGFRPDMELIKAQLAQVGMDLVLSLRTDTEIGSVIRSGRYDLRMSDFTRPDPDVMLGLFSSKYNSTIKAPQPELDALLDKQSSAMDNAERAKLVREVQEMMVGQGYAIPIKESISVVGTAPNVHGLWMSTPRWPVFHDTYIAAE